MNGEDARAPLVLIDVDGVLSPEFTRRRPPFRCRPVGRCTRFLKGGMMLCRDDTATDRDDSSAAVRHAWSQVLDASICPEMAAHDNYFVRVRLHQRASAS